MDQKEGARTNLGWKSLDWKNVAICFGVLALLGFAYFILFDHVPAIPYMWLIAWRIVELLLSILAGFVVGAIFSPLLKGARFAAMILVLGLVAVFALVAPTPAADFIVRIVEVIGAIAAFFIGLRLGAEAIATKQRPRPTSYGSAKWATFDYLKGKGLLSPGGFLLGTFREGESNSRLRYKGERHMLTVAPTRSGKGVSAIIPNLLTHSGSALIIDPKGENALITAQRRGAGDPRKGIEGLGQRVILLDPWDVAATSLALPKSKFNPLDWIKAGDPDAVENAFILADALVMKEAGSRSNETFWDEEAKSLLTGLIMYVATAEEEEGNRHLGRVRDILTLEPKRFDELLLKMFKHPDRLVSSTAARTAAKDHKLVSNVLATTQSHTHFLESPRIRESLLSSDFSFEDLKTDRVSVYLILPADRLETFNRWLRMLIQQAITVNARNIHVRPKWPILFMLDEMPTLGKLPSLEQAYGLMAGFGMQLWGIVQDLSQLAKIYGEHGWQTFISNSGVIQYFGSRDKMTAEYFSKLCGVTTIEAHNFSWAVSRAIGWSSGTSSSSGAGGGSSGSNSGSNETHTWTRTSGVSEAQRQLAYPDELMVLKDEEQIVFVENLDPIVGTKLPWYEDVALRKLGVNVRQPDEPKAIEAQPASIAGQTVKSS